MDAGARPSGRSEASAADRDRSAPDGNGEGGGYPPGPARVGTNVALLNAILHVLVRDDRIDKGFIEAHMVGFDGLRGTVAEYPPERAAGICGVAAGQIEAAGRMIGEAAGSLVSTCLQRVYQSNQATAAAVQVSNINLIRGMAGRPGCGILQMNGQP